MSKLRVAVLRGGPSNEYDVSLKTGATVLKELDREHYTPVDVFIDKTGTWHIDGLPGHVLDLRNHADVAWNALHGVYGEDGNIQRELESIGMPYTGSGVLASALAIHKGKAKELFARHGLVTPPWIALDAAHINDSVVRDIFRALSLPLIVKPMRGGSSIGISIAHSFYELYEALVQVSEHSSELLVESVVRGREATCGIIDGFRGEEHYALMPIEIVPLQDERFFSYNAKYLGASQEICPGRFSSAEIAAIQEAARIAHRALGARHYSRSDFIITSSGVSILETNTLPGLTDTSLIPKSLEATGCSLPHFFDHIIKKALGR